MVGHESLVRRPPKNTLSSSRNHVFGRGGSGLTANRIDPAIGYGNYIFNHLHLLVHSLFTWYRLVTAIPPPASFTQRHKRHVEVGSVLTGIVRGCTGTSMALMVGIREDVPAGCSNRPSFSPAQPRRAGTHLVPGKAATSEGPRRRISHPPTPSCQDSLFSAWGMLRV